MILFRSSLYIVFEMTEDIIACYSLILRGCFDRTHGLNKLFLHSMRRLYLCLIMIGHLVFFPCILLTRNNMIFLV